MATTISDNSIGKKIRNNIHDIIPIICDDLFEYVDQDGHSHSMNELMHLFLADNYDECEKDVFLTKNTYHAISYLENIQNTNVASYLHNKISEAITNKQIKLKGVVKDFLIAGKFPLIITTF